MQKIQSYCRNVYVIAGLIFCLAVLTYVLFVPKSYLAEAFFGGVPELYNPALARFFYEQSLRFDGENGKPEPYIYYQLVRIDFIEGDQTAALDKLNKELEIFPENHHAYYMLGLVYGFTNRENEGIEAFKKYIAYDESTWAARNDMAWLQFRIGDIQGALNAISEAYVLQPQNPWVLNTYGVMLMNSGDYDTALTMFTNGITIAERMTEDDWGKAYPGNDPRIYGTGLAAMRASLKENLDLVNAKRI